MCKDDTQVCEAFYIYFNGKGKKLYKVKEKMEIFLLIFPLKFITVFLFYPHNFILTQKYNLKIKFKTFS